MKRLILLILVAAFANAGVARFTAKHVVKPVVVHVVFKPVKLLAHLLW